VKLKPTAVTAAAATAAAGAFAVTVMVMMGADMSGSLLTTC
jgi:hypothetical protein